MKKVLLVDDTEFYLKSYKMRLGAQGYVVTTASNGLEAIKALATDKPDVVILDLMMPMMDGFKVLQTIRADANLSQIPVVVLSARGNKEEIDKALAAGATDFLVKATITPDKVLEKIKQVTTQ